MDDNDYVLAFDHFYTTNHIQILKSLLPFIEHESAAMLPVIVKYMELKYTLSLIQKGKKGMTDTGIYACSEDKKEKENAGMENNIEQIYNAVHRYLTPDEEKGFSQILSAVQTMKNMHEMQQMVEMLQNLNPDIDIGNAAALGGMDIKDLMQMLKQ